MSIRTDLAVESTAKYTSGIPGITGKNRSGNGCEISEVIIESDEAGAKISKKAGRYITVETDRLSAHPEEFDGMAQTLADEIGALCPEKDSVMILGLGNAEITPDALGPQVISKIIATRHFEAELPEEHPFSKLPQVAALAPGVLGQTGSEVAEMAAAIVRKIKPRAVVVIDALACADVTRLGTTIQLTDTGISPGSGVANARKELSEKTLGVPVIAVGVPTVVDFYTIAENLTGSAPDKKLPNMMVTPRDVDKLIVRTAKLVACAINRCFLPFSFEDINAMTD